MPDIRPAPVTEPRLRPELMLQVSRALNFDPEEFAKRHLEEFVHLYLRVDGMLSYVGEEIVSYLANRINECLSKAEYALLSYIEYAGRAEKKQDSDCFSEAVARYLDTRQRVGGDWVYLLRGGAKARCLAAYPQMHAIAQAMYAFSKEIKGAEAGGKDRLVRRPWPDPKKLKI